MKHFRLIWIALGVFLFSAHALAEYDPGKKAEAKKASRWTLEEWLSQKSRMGLMDQWLALNTTESPYEFYLAADGGNLRVYDGDDQDYYRGHIGAFSHMVGLEGSYETRGEDLSLWSAQFTLRLLGTAHQGTRLSLHYGVLNRDNDGNVLKNQYGAASLSFYLLQGLGLLGKYQYFFPEEDDLGMEIEGYRASAQGFVEFGFLRVYLEWVYESLKDSRNTNEHLERTEGFQFGLQVFL